MNGRLWKWYLEKLFEEKEERLLTFDCFSGHGYNLQQREITSEFQEFYQQQKLNVVMIPENTTRWLQPLDTHINKVFKTHIRTAWCSFMVKKIGTNIGNRALIEGAANIRESFCEWVLEAWEKVSPELVKKAFVETGISAALDGSDESRVKLDLTDFKKCMN